MESFFIILIFIKLRPRIPGAMIVERVASVYDGFPQVAPLVYHYGQVSVQQNPKLYDTIVSQMAELVHERMESNAKGIYFFFKCKIIPIFIS